MSAYRQAMLAVPPERLEQFSLEMQQNIDDNDKKKKQSSSMKEKSHKHKGKKGGKEDEKKSKQKSHKGNKKRPTEKNRKNKNVKEKRKRRRRKSDEEARLTGDSDMEDGGLNLEKDLHPLSFYVKDRKHLMDHVFGIVKGPKLSAMLPDILKNIPPEELKRKCLEQLEVMSSKRINHVLAGEMMSSSSGTDSSDDESSEALPKVSTFKANLEQPTVQANFVDSTTTASCEVLSLLDEGSKRTTLQEENVLSAPKDAGEVESEEGEVTSDEEITIVEEEEELESSDVEIETVEVVEDEEYQEMVDEMLEETMPSGKHEKESEKTQLELLELQLRERAIKSLMRAAGKLDEK